MQRRHGEPVRRDVRHEIRQARDGVGVIEVVVVAGGEDRHDPAAGRGDGALVGAAGLGAQQRLDLIELQLRVLHGEVRERRIAAAQVETIGDADAPAVVDDACAAGDQRVPTRLVHRAIVAQDDAILGARVAVVGADDLRIVRHTVHRAAIATAGSYPADMGAVGTQLAIGAHSG